MSNVEQVERRLYELSQRAKDAYERGLEGIERGLDSFFAVGSTLLEARQMFGENDKGYGQWVDAQGFSFSASWASTMLAGAKYEGAVRRLLASQLASSGSMNFDKAVREVRAALNPAPPKKKSKKQVAAVGDGASSDASGAVSEATATPDTDDGEGSAPEPESVPGENPRVVDESTTDAEKDAIRDEWMAAIEATDDASDGDGPDGARSTGGPEPDEEPRAPTPVSSSGSNSAGSSARVAGPEPRRVPPASGSGTGRKRQQAKQDRGREIVISHRQVSVSERPVEYVEAYFAAHQSELPEFVAALESEGEQVAELLAALRPLAKAVQ